MVCEKYIWVYSFFPLKVSWIVLLMWGESVIYYKQKNDYCNLLNKKSMVLKMNLLIIVAEKKLYFEFFFLEFRNFKKKMRIKE